MNSAQQRGGEELREAFTAEMDISPSLSCIGCCIKPARVPENIGIEAGLRDTVDPNHYDSSWVPVNNADQQACT